MSTDRHGLFKQLEPPPGGVEGLCSRLDGAGREARMPRFSLAAAAAASVLVVAGAAGILLSDDRDREPEPRLAMYDAPQFDRLLGRPLERAEPSVTVNERTAKLVEIRTANERIRIYRIEDP